MKISMIPILTDAMKKKKKRKKTDAERNADALYAEHLLYRTLLCSFRGIPSLPLGAYGETHGYRYLVMQRLGRTLDQALKSASGQLPEPLVATMGLQLVDIFEYLHSKKLLFVDVKPDNFMLERSDSESQVYCVDFGISERYVAVNGKHKELRLNGAIVGTPAYLSLHCHSGGSAGRRDDLEAMVYVLVYLMRGNLPWSSAKSDEEGAKIKRDTSHESLCAGFSHQWVRLLENLRACPFEQAPAYAEIREQLKDIAGKKDMTNSTLNWTMTKSGTSKSGTKPTGSPGTKREASSFEAKSKSKKAKSTPSPVIDTSKPQKTTTKSSKSKTSPALAMVDLTLSPVGPKKPKTKTKKSKAAEAAEIAIAAAAIASAAAKSAREIVTPDKDQHGNLRRSSRRSGLPKIDYS